MVMAGRPCSTLMVQSLLDGGGRDRGARGKVTELMAGGLQQLKCRYLNFAEPSMSFTRLSVDVVEVFGARIRSSTHLFWKLSRPGLLFTCCGWS